MRETQQLIVTDLLSNLHEEIAVFEELRVVLEEERDALVELDVPAILSCTARKERVAGRHHELEVERRTLAERFFLLDRSLKPGARLSEVAAAARSAGVDAAGELDRVRERLSCLMDSVAEMNRLNERFVAHSLVVVQGVSEMMHRAVGDHVAPAPPTYAASGRMQSTQSIPDRATNLQATG